VKYEYSHEKLPKFGTVSAVNFTFSGIASSLE